MGIPVSMLVQLATAADDDGICLSQTPLAGGDLTIAGALASGGVATMDAQRRVIITSAADDTGRTFTVYGTNSNGNAISQAVTGANAGAATTTLDFKTVTRVAVDAATAGAVKVGTNGVGASPWKATNTHISPVNLGINCVVAGTVNYTFQYTLDLDPCGITSNTPVTPANSVDVTALAAKTATTQSSITTPITAWRIVINSGTGSVLAQVTEAGIEG